MRPVVVVTGGSRGIGAHLSRGFAEAGYAVELTSRDGEGARRLADELSRQGLDAVGSALDVAEPDLVQVFVEQLLQRHAQVDVLVNNGGGRVINLNSGSGTRADDLQSAYHASKTALARITGGLHLAGSERGIRAFDLAPGVVRTDMTEAMPQHRGRTEWTEPADVVTLALALASGELDAWSGRMVRAGTDTVESLRSAAAAGLSEQARTIGLLPYGEDDPLA